MNLNLIDHDGNTQVESHLNLLFQSSYIPVISKPRRISETNTTLLDHINANSFLDRDITKGILKVDVSDYGPTFFISKETDIYLHNEVVYITRRYI